MAGVVNQLEYSCLICNASVTVENQLRFSSVNEKKSLDLFLLKILLEISETVIFVNEELNEEKGSRHEHWQWLISNNWKDLQTCEKCGANLKQASLIYDEIKVLILKFRGIQKKIVESFKNCNATRCNDKADKHLNNFLKQCQGIVEHCKFCKIDYLKKIIPVKIIDMKN